MKTCCTCALGGGPGKGPEPGGLVKPPQLTPSRLRPISIESGPHACERLTIRVSPCSRLISPSVALGNARFSPPGPCPPGRRAVRGSPTHDAASGAALKRNQSNQKRRRFKSGGEAEASGQLGRVPGAEKSAA